jgi:hypothetical protein
MTYGGVEMDDLLLTLLEAFQYFDKNTNNGGQIPLCSIRDALEGIRHMRGSDSEIVRSILTILADKVKNNIENLSYEIAGEIMTCMSARSFDCIEERSVLPALVVKLSAETNISPQLEEYNYASSKSLVAMLTGLSAASSYEHKEILDFIKLISR